MWDVEACGLYYETMKIMNHYFELYNLVHVPLLEETFFVGYMGFIYLVLYLPTRT